MKSKVFEDPDRPNNIMLAVRTFSNLFETSQGRGLAEEEFDIIDTLVDGSTDTSNRNLTIAVTTLYVNYAVLFTSSTHPPQQHTISRSKMLMNHLTRIIRSTVDSEAVYRGLVAAGTLLSHGEYVQEDSHALNEALDKAEKAVKEPRVKGVVGEIRALMIDSRTSR